MEWQAPPMLNWQIVVAVARTGNVREYNHCFHELRFDNPNTQISLGEKSTTKSMESCIRSKTRKFNRVSLRQQSFF